ncbi:deoxyhypusine synthase [Anaeramoeba flamelloides]|uniref:deoxyhypusine synthase n=1 Tax=Anaeramoeba flamelloides TaxID=1746091 RepID=A0AAV7Y9B7_9EUKA|nr:deoxyhypusine synthase [Anaeramoeba flamelloides]KAJ6236689.1 deoxyhypusine synthase [Anaeramoeba flamelloides]
MEKDNTITKKDHEKILEFVLTKKDEINVDLPIVKGYDFNKGIDFEKIMKKYLYQGFQSTNLGLAIKEINKMLHWRLSDEPIPKDEEGELADPEFRKTVKCTIFLGFTSNMISSGTRELLRFIVQHNLVSAIVTTGGGIEEDIMKCFSPTYHGDFELKGNLMRKKGLNRIGNLIIPNKNYCEFEDWLLPILGKMLKEQKEDGVKWTPSKMIHRLGLEINNEESVWYWAAKNNIPVYSPAITDGSIGDMLYFFSYNNPGLVLDVVEDVIAINKLSAAAHKRGMIIIGGGLVKHHICNANLMGGGADFSVYINTAIHYDGSDAGATPDEAVSWGKIHHKAKPVKIFCEATLVLPLIVAETFAKYVHKQKKLLKNTNEKEENKENKKENKEEKVKKENNKEKKFDNIHSSLIDYLSTKNKEEEEEEEEN